MKANIYIDFPNNIYHEICIKDLDENICKVRDHFIRLYPLERYEHTYKNNVATFINMDTDKEIDIVEHPTYRENGFLEECNIKLNLKIIKKEKTE